MSQARYIHEPNKFCFLANATEKWIVNDVRVSEKPILDAVPQDPQGRSLVSQNAKTLSNFVNCFGIANARSLILFSAARRISRPCCG